MRVWLLWVLLALPTLAQAQYVAGDTAQAKAAKSAPSQAATPKPSIWDRTQLGGNFSFNFGRVTYLEASPLLLFNATPRLQIGPGLTYIYLRNNVRPFVYSTSVYGGRLFGRYFPLPDIYLQSELEALSFEARNADYNGRYTIFNPLVGGGYRVPFGSGRGGLYITALYNLNYQSNLSPYPSPLIVRVGAAF